MRVPHLRSREARSTRPLSRLPLALLLVLSLVVAQSCTSDEVGRIAQAQQAVVQPSDENSPPPGPPLPPKPLESPSIPIEKAASVGYLPATAAVGPLGQYTATIPIEVPPGRAGLEPRLALTYDSGAGNGIAGVGWSLSGLSQITRCPTIIAAEGITDGVDYDDTDSYCLDGAKLVVVGPYANGATEYRTEDDSFARIVATGIGQPLYFDVYRKDGHIRRYEHRLAPRIQADAQGGISQLGSVMTAWPMVKEADRAGNVIRYSYWQAPTGDFLLKTITYTEKEGLNEPAKRWVNLSYETRPDPVFAYQSGVKTRMGQRLKAIQMFAPNPDLTDLVWEYTLTYATSQNSGRSLLTSVERCGALGGCLWKKEFGWDDALLPSYTAVTHPLADSVWKSHVLDVNGDGIDDSLSMDIKGAVHLRLGEHTPSGPTPLSRAVTFSGEDFWGVEMGASRPLDHNGDGDVSLWATRIAAQSLADCGQQRFDWNDVTETFESEGIVIPSEGEVACSVDDKRSTPPRVDFVDLDGDGLLDMVRQAGMAPLVPGSWSVQRNTQNQGFAAEQSTGVGVVKQCPQRKGTDIDGDGRGELLVPAELLPDAEVCASGMAVGTDDQGQVVATPTIPLERMGVEVTLADLNGDGLEDALWFGSQTELRWNTGNGFEPPVVVYGVAGDLSEVPVIVADVNNDRRDDLLTLDASDGSTLALLSKGDGAFTYLDTGITALVKGDYNGDGLPDFLRASEGRFASICRRPRRGT